MSSTAKCHPTLNDMIYDGGVNFLMGAGASMDYGFPSWQGLKAEYARIVNDPKYQNLPSFELFQRWVEDWNNGSETRNIDALVREALASAPSILDTFRVLTSDILLVREEKDKKFDGWIEKLSQIVAKNIEQIDCLDTLQNYLNSVTFTTLNYDRVFEWHYLKNEKIADSLMRKNPIYDETVAFFHSNILHHTKVLHPHGVIGCLSADERSFEMQTGGETRHAWSVEDIGYGEVSHNCIPESFGFMPAGSIKIGFNEAFEEAKQVLTDLKHVVCIGLSSAGFISSQLEIEDNNVLWFWSPECDYPSVPEKGITHFMKGSAEDLVTVLSGDIQLSSVGPK